MKRILFVLVCLSLLFVSPGLAAEWTFDKAHTNISFQVKHLMITNVKGLFSEFSGTIKYDPQSPTEAVIVIQVDVASINTNNNDRDEHLRNPDFFNVAKFPTMTFKSNQIARAENGDYKLIGDLTIKDVTKRVELEVEGPTAPISFMGTERIAASAQGTINRTDFGLTWNRVIESGGIVVGEEVRISIDAELVKK